MENKELGEGVKNEPLFHGALRRAEKGKWAKQKNVYFKLINRPATLYSVFIKCSGTNLATNILLGLAISTFLNAFYFTT